MLSTWRRDHEGLRLREAFKVWGDLVRLRSAWQAEDRDLTGMAITALIFVLVYVVMALGRLPGFKLDRTGASVAGAMAMIATGAIGPAQSWDAIDYRSIGMLFGLMVVSAAFVDAGFYRLVARKVASLPIPPPALLAVLIAVAGLLSAVLTNDVMVVAMTPLLVSITLARGLNPTPFLLGFCFAANTGSAATLMGSPHMMIAAQSMQLSFNGFLTLAGPPAALSLPIVWGALALVYRRSWTSAMPAGAADTATDLAFDRSGAAKAGLVTVAVMLGFTLTDMPREVIALGAAAILLVNRKVASSALLQRVNGALLLLVMGLFVVNAAMAATGMPQAALSRLREAGVDLGSPMTLYFVSAALSKVIGNNATVMLLAPFLDHGARRDLLGAALALGLGFSASLVVFGSMAGIIAVNQAGARGVRIGAWEFSRAGLAVALPCLAMGTAWIWFLG